MFPLLLSSCPHNSIVNGAFGFNVEGMDMVKLGVHLWEKHHIIVTPIVHDEFRGIRVTPNVYTTLDEIDMFCDAVEHAIRTGLSA